MQESPQQANEFEAVKTRLEEIARTVGDEDMSLDAALDLYEEAVALGLRASDLLEEGITLLDEGVVAGGANEAIGTEAAGAAEVEKGADAAGDASVSGTEKLVDAGDQAKSDSKSELA